MTTFTLRTGSPAKTKVDVVVIGVARKKSRDKSSSPALEVIPGADDIAEAYGRKLVPLLRSFGFGGAPGEVLRLPATDAIKASQIVAVGVGDRDALDLEAVRRAAGVAARNGGNAASVALALPAQDPEHLIATVGGFLSGSYTFDNYKSSAKKSGLSDVIVMSEAARKADMIAALKDAQIIDDSVNQVRDWVNTPPNDLSPEAFADSAVAWGNKLHGRRKVAPVTTEVLDEAALTELGCGGILGVGMGSQNPPRLVRLSYAPEDAVASIALVGKGITFDSGGLSIKPATGMPDMKSDMAGAAAVIAATHAIARLGLPVQVTTFAPMAENMPGGSALRPGDVITMHNGKTVEISNTDAEGRLVLADALAMAVEQQPDVIIDVATLTGACIVALGDRIAGVMGTEDVVAEISAAAEDSGELVWPLPIPEDKRDDVTQGSRIADVLQHKFVRWGGALYAAAFLEQFTDARPWAHIDIAGPSYNTGSPWGAVPSGGTGFGVTTLVEFVRRMAANQE